MGGALPLSGGSGSGAGGVSTFPAPNTTAGDLKCPLRLLSAGESPGSEAGSLSPRVTVQGWEALAPRSQTLGFLAGGFGTSGTCRPSASAELCCGVTPAALCRATTTRLRSSVRPCSIAS